MFCHPFMAHHHLNLMMHKVCVIDEHLYEIMKKAFIDDVLNMMKIPEDTKEDNNNSNGNVSHDAGVGNAADDESKHLFGMYIYPFHWSLVNVVISNPLCTKDECLFFK